SVLLRPPRSLLFPYTTLFRSVIVDHADRRHLELVVAAQVPTELDAAHVELLEREAAHIAEDRAGLGRQPEGESNRVAAGGAATKRPHRDPDRARADVALELAVTAEDAAVQLGREVE